MKKIPLIFALILFSIGILRAQNQSISGKVTSSEDGEALPGVSISVVGTSIGATTDIDGNFKINVERGKSLKFSFVGFKSKTIKVGNQSTINLELEVDETQLIEVFVTGAYEVKRSKRSDPTNSQLVDQKALNVIRQTDINNALASAGDPNWVMELRTVSANQCIIYDPLVWNNFLIPITSGGTGVSGYGSFAPIFTFDLNTDQIINCVNYYGQPAGNTRSGLDPSGVNQYDAATKTVRIKYNMTQSSLVPAAPHIRTTWDETWKYVGSR